MSPHVRFEDEAEAEYCPAGRWYEARRAHLGVEFFDAIDATIDQIVATPRAGSLVPRLPPDLPVRRRAVTRFPYHVVYIETPTQIRAFSLSRTTAAGPDTGKAVCGSTTPKSVGSLPVRACPPNNRR